MRCGSFFLRAVGSKQAGTNEIYYTQKKDWKCVTDITEGKVKNDKLCVSVKLNCYDLTAIGLAMGDNIRAELCTAIFENAVVAYQKFSKANIAFQSWKSVFQ